MRLTGPTEIAARLAPAPRTKGDAPLQPAANAERKPPTGVASTVDNATHTPAFDGERVAAVRKAIEEGRYPLVPARIADAMIAAKLYGMIAS